MGKTAAEAVVDATADVQPDRDPATIAQDTLESATATRLEDRTPPESRWPSILENARTKAREETEAELETRYRERYGWADGLERDRVQRALGIVEAIESDPIGFHRGGLDRLKRDPKYASLLQQEPEPQPDIRTRDPETEEEIYLYSDKQLRKWHAWNQRQADARLGELREEIAGVRDEMNVRTQREQVDNQLTELLTELRKAPSFKQHEAKIFDRFLKYPDPLILKHGVGAMLRQAWLDILTDPTTTKAVASSEAERLREKQAASSMRPAGAAGEAPKRPRTTKELAKHLEATFG